MIQIETVSWEWHSNHNNKILGIIWGTLLVVIDRLFYFLPIFALCLINWTWHFNDVLWILKNSPLFNEQIVIRCKNHLTCTSITHSGCSGRFSGQNGQQGTFEASSGSEDIPVSHWRWLSCKLWIAAGDEVHRLNLKSLQQRPIWDSLMINASHVALLNVTWSDENCSSSRDIVECHAVEFSAPNCQGSFSRVSRFGRWTHVMRLSKSIIEFQVLQSISKNYFREKYEITFGHISGRVANIKWEIR